MSGRVAAVEGGQRLSPWHPGPPSRVLLGAVGMAWALAIAAELTGRADLFHHHNLVGGK